MANQSAMNRRTIPYLIPRYRDGKFGHYRQIPSLIEYLIFWQDEARVEQHTRTSEGLWLLRELVGIDQTLQLQSIKHPLPFLQVYDKVIFVEL